MQGQGLESRFSLGHQLFMQNTRLLFLLKHIPGSVWGRQKAVMDLPRADGQRWWRSLCWSCPRLIFCQQQRRVEQLMGFLVPTPLGFSDACLVRPDAGQQGP